MALEHMVLGFGRHDYKRNSLTLSPDDFRYMFRTWHRHTLRHVLALLASVLIGEGRRESLAG